MKVSICTLGCKVNSYESAVLSESFARRGCDIVDFGCPSDVIVIHSCAVTEESTRKTRQMMRRARRISPSAIIAVVGCLCQVDDVSSLDEADIILGSAEKMKLPFYVSEFMTNRIKIICVGDISSRHRMEKSRLHGGERTRAQVKIEDGCDNYCTYCVIPYARGHVRSKPIDDAFREIHGLVSAGYKETVLTGIHLDSYGKDSGDFDIFTLLEMIDPLDGLVRVRLGSLEPKFITDENAERLSQLKKLCPQFHLSLQSGCDKTLKAMKRRYDTSEYRQAVSQLRKWFSDVAVTTDVIVGFPGETDEDFAASIEFVKSIGFSKVHVFPYSPRSGTVAAEMEGQISVEIKKHRAAEMLKAADAAEAEFLQGLVGKTVPVLFEQRKNGFYFGHTATYAEVAVKTDSDIANKIVNVKVEQACETYCIGSAAEI